MIWNKGFLWRKWELKVYLVKLSTYWSCWSSVKSENSSHCMCLSRSCQALPGLIKWSATLCIVTPWCVLAATAMSCRALMPKSGLSWWMGSLSPSNYRWIFRCIHYLSWPGLCVCVWVRGLLLHRLNCRGSAGVCRGVRGSCFSSAVGSLQYSWAPWGSVCCAVLRAPLSQTAFFPL